MNTGNEKSEGAAKGGVHGLRIGSAFLLSVICTLVIQLCSIRAVVKYIPHPFFAYLAICFISFALIYFLLTRVAGARWLRSPLPAATLAMLLFVANIIIYPKVDAKKLEGQGSDADDAVIVATTKLFHGQFPYDELTYLGHKMSPGPGMLILMSPFVLTGMYALAIPFYILLFAVFMRRITGTYLISAIALTLVVISPGLWEYMCIGSDLTVISCLLALVGWLALTQFEKPKLLNIIAVFAGLVFTSRITLVYVSPIIGLILFMQNKRAGIRFTLISLAVCVGVHAGFYFWQPGDYAPMHLLAKGEHSTNLPTAAIAMLSMLVLVISFFRVRKFNTFLSLWYYWLFLAVPHLFIGIGMVQADHFRLKMSEGPGYLIIQIFPFLMYFLISLARKIEVGFISAGSASSLQHLGISRQQII